MLRPIIVGFGHCGRDLHLRCLQVLTAQGRSNLISTQIRLVDPHPEATALEPRYTSYRELPAAGSDPTGHASVVHVCTPPPTHLACVLDALAKGYRFIIVEKPLAPTLDEALQIHETARNARAVVLVVAVWLNSPLARHIGDQLHALPPSMVTDITIVHNKSRLSRTLARQDEHVFDIEMPHQISLAHAILGGRARLLKATANDLIYNGTRKAHMARGEITLASDSGCVARLVSNLHHPARERSIAVRLNDGRRLFGYFPVNADDSFSQLFEYSAANALLEHRVFNDDPLSACLERSYLYMAAVQAGQSPASPMGMSLDFNIDVVDLLHEAKRQVAAAGQSLPADPVMPMAGLQLS